MPSSFARRCLPFKKPMLARFLSLAALAHVARVAAAQEVAAARPHTEAEVVALALGRVPVRDVLEGEVKLERGRGVSASRYPNPELSYVREQTFGALGSAEDNLSIRQTIDVGNRRGLRGEAGEARARAARLDGDALRLTIAAEARERFYELLYRQDRVGALERWLGQVDEALGIVRRREHSGDVATYERLRFERERAVAVGRLESERAACTNAQAKLHAYLGIDTADLRVAGTLLPAADPDDLAKLRAAGQSRPELRALDQRLDAASKDRDAATRGWVPELTLEGGWKGVDFGSAGRSDGFIVGASLSLPVWDRASGDALGAEGEMQIARARRTWVADELAAELGGSRAVAVRLRRATLEFDAHAIAASAQLVRIASAGYQGGEIGVLELLDAYRGAADDALTALELAYAARRARLELDRLTGAER